MKSVLSDLKGACSGQEWSISCLAVAQLLHRIISFTAYSVAQIQTLGLQIMTQIYFSSCLISVPPTFISASCPLHVLHLLVSSCKNDSLSPIQTISHLMEQRYADKTRRSDSTQHCQTHWLRDCHEKAVDYLSTTSQMAQFLFDSLVPSLTQMVTGYDREMDQCTQSEDQTLA